MRRFGARSALQIIMLNESIRTIKPTANNCLIAIECGVNIVPDSTCRETRHLTNAMAISHSTEYLLSHHKKIFSSIRLQERSGRVVGGYNSLNEAHTYSSIYGKLLGTNLGVSKLRGRVWHKGPGNIGRRLKRYPDVLRLLSVYCTVIALEFISTR